jgi:hypothetical protein
MPVIGFLGASTSSIVSSRDWERHPVTALDALEHDRPEGQRAVPDGFPAGVPQKTAKHCCNADQPNDNVDLNEQSRGDCRSHDTSSIRGDCVRALVRGRVPRLRTLELQPRCSIANPHAFLLEIFAVAWCFLRLFKARSLLGNAGRNPSFETRNEPVVRFFGNPAHIVIIPVVRSISAPSNCDWNFSGAVTALSCGAKATGGGNPSREHPPRLNATGCAASVAGPVELASQATRG